MTDQATPPRFTFSDPTEPETRAERRARIVHEAIGAASVCWSQPPAGVFDEQGARQIAAALLAELDALSTTTLGPLSLTFPGGIGPGIPDEHLFVVDTRTGKPVRPHPTWHPGAAASAAALMFPGWPAEQIDAAYGAWMSVDTPPTVAKRLMAAGGIVTGKTGPVLDLPEHVVPPARSSGLTPGGSCRVTPEPHDHPDTRQDHDTRRAELLADDLERDPDRARARTNSETIATVRAAALILRTRAADLAARHERVHATCDAIDRLSLIN